MKKIFSRIYNHVLNPPTDDELKRAWQQSDIGLPVLWLLGKTGSGKSSIVQQLTGKSRAEIGSGFRPCTRESSFFDYPAERPILRFLDTRGLGEVEYDAAEDIAELGKKSHAVLVVTRIMDPEQGAVLDALRKIRSAAKHIRREAIIAVHTGADELDDGHDRQRAVETQHKAIESAWKSTVDTCATGFGRRADSGELNDLGADRLRELIARKVPELSLWLAKGAHRDAEHENFEKLKTEVLWYAGSAAASDAIPLVGLVSVPAVQGKMLHSLARRYGVDWNTRNFSEFTAALGTSFALRYATGLGARQLAKLVPGFGQLVGSAFAMTVSYASTYALGRAACGYLYHKKTATDIGEVDLHALYNGALVQGRRAGKEALRADGE
jgi:uncharacterized protein (DUF697 family)/GTP-binding protein EngB required for normal cell division